MMGLDTTSGLLTTLKSYRKFTVGLVCVCVYACIHAFVCGCLRVLNCIVTSDCLMDDFIIFKCRA